MSRFDVYLGQDCHLISCRLLSMLPIHSKHKTGDCWKLQCNGSYYERLDDNDNHYKLGKASWGENCPEIGSGKNSLIREEVFFYIDPFLKM